MRRLARYTFAVAAVLSLLTIVFVVWLCWGDGRELSAGSIVVLGHEGNATLIAGSFRNATTGTRTWTRGNLYVGLANNYRFAFAQIPRWLILACASVLPAIWLVAKVVTARRSTAPGFDVQPANGPPRAAGDER